jgi:hypothetical protein
MMSLQQIADPAEAALVENRDASTNKSYLALAASSGIPKPTLWHHAHGRRSRKAKAASQQYLTPQEERRWWNISCKRTGTDIHYQSKLFVLWHM